METLQTTAEREWQTSRMNGAEDWRWSDAVWTRLDDSRGSAVQILY